MSNRFANPENALHKINVNKLEEKNERLLGFYTLKGSEDFIDDFGFPRTQREESLFTHAKYIETNGSVRYFIKMSKTGRMFNPLGLYDQVKKQARRESKPEWTFIKVSQEVFGNYIMFLKTRNESYLNNAERELI